METKVFCPAWATVLAQRPDLKLRIDKGEATPAEVTAAFKQTFGLDDVQANVIKGVLALTDIKDFVRNRVSLEHITTSGPAIHMAIDFGIERLRSELKRAQAPEPEIVTQANAKFDTVFDPSSVIGEGGERVIPLSSKTLVAITRANIAERLREQPNANDSVVRADVVMASELAAAAAFLHPFMGRPDLSDGTKTISYNELRAFFTEQKMPERKVGVGTAPNPFMLTLETSARLVPGGFAKDLERSFSNTADAGCPFAGRLIQTVTAQHPPIIEPKSEAQEVP